MAEAGEGAGGFFELASEPMGVVSRTGLAWERVNSAFERLLGWGSDELRGEPVQRLVHPDDRADLDSAVASIDEADGRASVALHLLKAEGGYAPFRWRLAAAEGDRLLCAGHPAEGEEARRDARIRALGHEIEHRVRNNLAVIRAIIRRTAEAVGDEQSFAHLQGRIDAFARVQAKIRLAGGEERGVDLALLVEDELLAQSMREGEPLVIEGPNLCLAPRPAETIALAVHELAVNAFKFGAFSTPGARTEVRWRIRARDGERRLVLTWSEFGVAIGEAPADEGGFGMETLMRSLPYDLMADTEMEFTRDGVRFSLSVPLERVVLPGAE